MRSLVNGIAHRGAGVELRRKDHCCTRTVAFTAEHCCRASYEAGEQETRTPGQFQTGAKGERRRRHRNATVVLERSDALPGVERRAPGSRNGPGNRATFHSNSTGAAQAAQANAALAREARLAAGVRRGGRRAPLRIRQENGKRADLYMVVWRNSEFQVVRTYGYDPFAPRGAPGGVGAGRQGDVGYDAKFGKLTCGESDNENRGRSWATSGTGTLATCTSGGAGAAVTVDQATRHLGAVAKKKATARQRKRTRRWRPGVPPAGKKARGLQGAQGAASVSGLAGHGQRE